MSALLPLIIQLVSGAVGGNVAGALLKKLAMHPGLATILGAIGGVGGGQLVDLFGLLENISGAAGGGLLGSAGAAGGGGALLTVVVGLIKKVLSGAKDAVE